MQAFFILGTHRDISREELRATLGDRPSLVDAEDTLILGDVGENLGAELARLGGTIKTGAIHASAKDREEMIDAMVGLVWALRPGTGKVRVGLSAYHGGHRGKLAAMKTDMERIGMTLKRKLQEGRPVRLVTSKIPVLSSVIVKKQRLLEDGIEFCLFPDENEIRIGVTEAVQDFEEWGERDFNRPARDARRGMLPPKLARTMINLTKVDPATATLLDPFCGVGTVLAEGMALGFTKLVGSDIDEKAAEATRTNIAWEAKRTSVDVEPQIIQSSAESLGSFLAPGSVDAIASEVFLGTPRTGEEDRAELERRLEALTEVYMESFRGLAAVLKPGARCIFAIPVYVHGGFMLTPKIVEKAALFGFKVEPFEAKSATADGALRYGRERQLVWRDLYRFRLEG